MCVSLEVFLYTSSCYSNPELRMNFPKLEKLSLDDNKLSHASTFAVLAGLRK